MSRKLILDVDTGTDDAVAIMLAALHPELDLVGCTTINGNLEVSYCTDNSLRTLDHIGRSTVPVFEGYSKPLFRSDFPIPRKDRKPTGNHVRELDIPAARSRKQSASAVEFLIETYRRTTDEITLVPVAPLTNIAAAIMLDPKIVDRIPEIVIMGGAHWTGNVTPAAEFNIWGDPEASAMVFRAPFRKRTLVPLDATHKALVSRDDCNKLGALGTPAGKAASSFIGRRILAHTDNQPMELPDTAPVHDAVCVAYLVDPQVITTRHLHVAIETTGALTVGRTVIDTNFRGGQPPNTHVAFHADARRFVDLLLTTFAAPAMAAAGR
ncbi:MAG: nucleoside hydrolase [Proteobacteria bacterium]|nr:nucleoside hydrolase [Pseudomonadota bacterium]